MFPRISLLDPAQIEEVHARTLDVLWRTGVRYASPRALGILREAGAVVDEATMVAHLPADLIERALATAPRTVLLAGRDPGQDMHLDGSTTYLTLDGSGAYTLDFRTGERRPSTAADMAEATRLADSLPEVDMIWGQVSATDVPANSEVIEELAILLRNSGKHVQSEVQRPEELPFVMELLAAAADDGCWNPERPTFSIVYCPVSPLQHEAEMVEAAIDLVPYRAPVAIYSLALAGATAPPTLAGGILQTNAEILSALVLFQLVEPGCPLIYVADCGIIDMHTGLYVCAGPEAILMNMGLADMGRFYELPVMATGFSSDSKDLSMGTGLDGGMTALASAMAQVDLLCGIGMLDAAQMLYLPKMILDAEVMRVCRRVAQGVAIDADHLLVDLIDAVGPGGQYLSARETRRFLRDGEHLRPRFFRHESYDSWLASRSSAVARAKQEVERLLAAHQPKPLPPGSEERFADVIERARASLPER